MERQSRHNPVCTAVALLGVALVGGFAGAASAAPCERLLAVQLTPDVPDPRDIGFLRSLLSNQVEYQLILRREIDDTNLLVELIGPGPAYRCQNAIQTIGRDGRVLSVTNRDGT